MPILLRLLTALRVGSFFALSSSLPAFRLDPNGFNSQSNSRNAVAQYATSVRVTAVSGRRDPRDRQLGGAETRQQLEGDRRQARADRLIVGISGASGTAYGVAALRLLKAASIETHLVMTRSAMVALAHELPLKVSEVRELASFAYRIEDVGAAIASGSFPTRGMLVVPCSIRSLSEIAYGTTSNLLTRAADVVLKERQRLVLMVRETPLHLGHLRAMTQVTEIGAVVMPPVPALYARPASIEELVEQSVGRALDLFGIDSGTVRRWGEDVGPDFDVGSGTSAL